MTLYLTKEHMGIYLKGILDKLFLDKTDYSIKNFSVTWINFKRNSFLQTTRYGYGLNNTKHIYPASIVKLVYGFATYCWIEKGILLFDENVNTAVFKMLSESSNDATSFIVDLLTGTTSGPSLDGKKWENWKYQRNIINEWLKNLHWDTLEGINCCQKTWEESPYGREKDFYGENNINKNLMSTDSTARIMIEIMQKIKYRDGNINLKSFLSRDLKRDTFLRDPNNQIEGFLGEGLPENIPFWSKAGLMSQVRHDAAWWTNQDLSDTLLVVFGNSQGFVNDKCFFPKLAKEIYRYNN